VESIALSSTVFGKLVIDVDGMISKWFFKIQRIMKNSHAIGLAAVAVIVTVAIEESRISAMRHNVNLVLTASSTKNRVPTAATSAEDSGAPIKTKSRSEIAPNLLAKELDTPDESFAKTARKMWENPAGKSMMDQGVKMAVAMMYQDFVDRLNLSKEEGDYFKNLLGKEMADQQALGLKMMDATPDERKALGEELVKRGNDNQAEIKKFLNSDEDFKTFTDYKDHMPERQHLEGIRSALSSKGAPLDTETESKLVEAMYRARTESKASDLSGPMAMDELAKGNLINNFEKNWEIEQKTLRGETAKFLNAEQQAAFTDYQKQAKEMQLMGLKMAEKMMPKSLDGILASPEKKVDFR